MPIERDPATVQCNLTRGKSETVEISDPSGAIDDPIGLDRTLRPALLIDDAEPVSRPLDALDLDPGVDCDPDPLALAVQLRDCIRIHIGKQPWQHFQDRDPRARSSVDVAEFECDHTAADKHDALGQSALAQHIIGSDHQPAPENGSRRGLEPVAMTMCLPSRISPSTATAFGPAKQPRFRITSTPRLFIRSASEPGMPAIIAFSRSISAAQTRLGLPTEM
jgi:hypothetical protein